MAATCPCVGGVEQCFAVPVYADPSFPNKIQFNPANDFGFASCACDDSTCDACGDVALQVDANIRKCQTLAGQFGLDPALACPIDFTTGCGATAPYTPCPAGTLAFGFILPGSEVAFEVCVTGTIPRCPDGSLPPCPILSCVSCLPAPSGEYQGNPGCKPGDTEDIDNGCSGPGFCSLCIPAASTGCTGTCPPGMTRDPITCACVDPPMPTAGVFV